MGRQRGHRRTPAPAALLALARIDVDGLLTLLVDALADPQKDVRIAAAQALGYHGSESAGLILRLKAQPGRPRAGSRFRVPLRPACLRSEGELAAGRGISSS